MPFVPLAITRPAVSLLTLRPPAIGYILTFIRTNNVSRNGPNNEKYKYKARHRTWTQFKNQRLDIPDSPTRVMPSGQGNLT